jgi:hypothetical protein
MGPAIEFACFSVAECRQKVAGKSPRLYNAAMPIFDSPLRVVNVADGKGLEIQPSSIRTDDTLVVRDNNDAIRIELDTTSWYLRSPSGQCTFRGSNGGASFLTPVGVFPLCGLFRSDDFGQFYRGNYLALLQTTDNVQTDLFRFALTTPFAYRVRAWVMAASAIGWAAMAPIWALARRVNNNSNLEGTVQAEGADRVSLALTGIATTIDVDDIAEEVRVRVTGLAATSITWRGVVEIDPIPIA